MSKLMWILGILLTAAGLALGLMVFASPASVVSWGITLELAGLLLVGGILSIGLGGVINALQNMPAQTEAPAYSAPPAAAPAPIPEFGRKPAESSIRFETPEAAAAVKAAFGDEVSEPVKETIAALEQARQKIEQAFEPAPAPAPAPEPAPEPEPAPAPPAPEVEALPAIAQVVAVPPDEPEAAEETPPEEELPAESEEVMEEGQLYVVEERFIRQRPARILSDGTVEAETDEGWMRFENLEHLDEYLDAMSSPANG